MWNLRMKSLLLFLFTINSIRACMQNAPEFETPPDETQAFMLEIVDDTLSEDEKPVVIHSDTSKCSVKCGEGVVTINTVDCKASCFPKCCVRKVKEIPCKSEEDCRASFGPWGSWSSCSLPCIENEKQKSERKRKRKCIDHCHEDVEGNPNLFCDYL